MGTVHRVVMMMVLAAFVSGGCANKPIAYRNVNFQDGVYDAEIMSIASHELAMSTDNSKFSSKGSFVRNRFTRCMENHAAVAFQSRKMFSQLMYCVIVDKRTGNVAKAGRMAPQKNSWAMMVRGIDGCYE